MAIEADVYRVRIRFERLFADPEIFDEPSRLAQRYLLSQGISPQNAQFISQVTKEVLAVDDSGKPSVVAGFAKYQYQGKALQSEYMKGANLNIEYADFGTGLSPNDHAGLWKRGKWGEMRFETRDFHHHHAKIELPDIRQLYDMLRTRADPTTIASVELSSIGDNMFQATVDFLEARLRQFAESDKGAVEVYAARNLTRKEKQALETRLTREATDSTVYVILSGTAASAQP